jgi:hypothetical protein
VTDSNGNTDVVDVMHDYGTQETRSTTSTKHADGSWSVRTNRSYTHTLPSETPYGGRGGFDEAWLDKSLPWLMDGAYVNWKRERDLVVSGGRVAQPGRGQQTSPATSDGPRVGTTAVTNCGDSGTNPCARTGGSAVDVRGRMGGLSQPPAGGPNGGPGNTGVPDPVPVPVPTD